MISIASEHDEVLEILEQVVILLHETGELSLGREEKVRLIEHFKDCPGCASFYKEFVEDELAAHIEPDELPAPLSTVAPPVN